MQAETRGAPSFDMHMPFGMAAYLAMPVAQVLVTTTMVLLSYFPSAAAAIFILAANPGESMFTADTVRSCVVCCSL